MKYSHILLTTGAVLCTATLMTSDSLWNLQQHALAAPIFTDATSTETYAMTNGATDNAIGLASVTTHPSDIMLSAPTTGGTKQILSNTNITPSKGVITDTMNDTNNELITYQPGFYYEPISEDMKKRIYGLSYKENCTVPFEELRYVSVLYTSFEDTTEVGEIICNKAIAEDLVEIFYALYNAQYPIEQIRLIDEYNADDDLSCLDNNSSCFNFRTVGNTKTLSKHALGLAIDINPFYNPYVTYPNGVERISPAGSEPYANRSADFAYKIDENDLCYQQFTAHGFTWGGHWKSLKDYQHFQK